MDLSPLDRITRQLPAADRPQPARLRSQVKPHGSSAGPTAAERILAAEMAGRAESHDALSMMVGSMARMVQAGKTRDSRWKAS